MPLSPPTLLSSLLFLLLPLLNPSSHSFLPPLPAHRSLPVHQASVVSLSPLSLTSTVDPLLPDTGDAPHTPHTPYTPPPHSPDNLPPPLIDLQTFLRLLNLCPTGGAAKLLIQSSQVTLNASPETRRARKLVGGDIVGLEGVEYDVEREVEKYGYRGGVKRDRPKRIQKKREKAEAAMEKAEVEAEGEKRAVVERAVERQMSQERATQDLPPPPAPAPEFGGSFRSEEFREERKRKKATRKTQSTIAKGNVGVRRWSFDSKLSAVSPDSLLLQILSSKVAAREALRAVLSFEEADAARGELREDFGVEVDDKRRKWWIEEDVA